MSESTFCGVDLDGVVVDFALEKSLGSSATGNTNLSEVFQKLSTSSNPSEFLGIDFKTLLMTLIVIGGCSAQCFQRLSFPDIAAQHCR